MPDAGPEVPTPAHRAALRELAEAAAGHDQDGASPTALCEPLRRHGLFTDVLPVEHGGHGWATDPATTHALLGFLLGLGGADLSAGRLFEGHLNAVKLVWRYGDDAQRLAMAEDVRAGAVAGVWNAEAPPGLRLEPAPEAGGAGRLAGGKIFCSGLGLVTRPVFTARAGEGGPVMLAPRSLRCAGSDLSGWTVQGMRATATGSVDFTGVEVAAEDVVGTPGDIYASPLFKGGAWRFAALHAGAVGRLATLARAELRARGRDGDPHQAARLGALAIAAETAELWVARAAHAAEDGALPPEAADAYVNLARTAVERAAMEATATAQRALGLSALTRPSPVERIARDLSTYLRQPFPDAALDEAARWLAARLGPPRWSRAWEPEP